MVMACIMDEPLDDEDLGYIESHEQYYPGRNKRYYTDRNDRELDHAARHQEYYTERNSQYYGRRERSISPQSHFQEHRTYDSLGSLFRKSRTAYIDTYPVGDPDQVDVKRSRDRSVSYSRTPPRTTRGYLASKSLAVQKSKQLDKPDGISGQVFETTGIIVNGTFVLEVSHMLFDTGASSTFISRAAAQAARLTIRACAPQTFTLADGRTTVHDQYVQFKIYISGVNQIITAYIEKHDTGHHVLVGPNTTRQFQGQANLAFGRKQETRWSIAQNKTGLRKIRYVLKEDSPMILPTLRVLDYYEGIRLARGAGETATQRNSREVLERHESRSNRIRQRYEHRAGPLYKGGANVV